MSRIEFRAAVEAPRPVAAWVMVGVGSAMLWITGQIAPWAMLTGAAMLVVSLLRRARPFSWQRSATVMNLGIFAIIGASASVARWGEPSTIPLAHFASLTQGLQLIDTRPRRSEFLLVTLALFQVVLASNLTDSVWFPFLLIAFVFATVWTLLLHTLHMEAAEAGQPPAAAERATAGLWRMTAVASGLSILLALGMFMVLPRLQGSVVRGNPIGFQMPTAGFSDKVALGDLGRIRQDATVVLRVETLTGVPPDTAAAYYRGLAFDHFDGTHWSVTPQRRHLVPGSAEGGIRLGHDPDQVNLEQRIVREPVEAGVLFGAGEIRGLQGTVRKLERDDNGGLYATHQSHQRVRYDVTTFRNTYGDSVLSSDTTAPPTLAGRLDARYQQLPTVTDRLTDLATRIVAEAENDAERVRAIEQFLRVNGEYRDTPPVVDRNSTVSPVEQFLFGGLAGHCEYFASAMVVLARSAGIPSRLVNGFAGGRENSIGGFRELTRSDAHAWVEVHYRRGGWVRYDPTPPDLRMGEIAPLSLADRMRELSSVAELWWYQSVLGFDRSDQIHAVKTAWLAWNRNRETSVSDPHDSSAASSARGVFELLGSASVLWPGVALAVVLGLGFTATRRRSSQAGIPRFYSQALRLLSRRGLEREPHVPARSFARAAAAQLPGPAAAHFESLTESYLAERFGARRPRGTGERLAALRESLRGIRSVREPRRACGSGERA